MSTAQVPAAVDTGHTRPPGRRRLLLVLVVVVSAVAVAVASLRLLQTGRVFHISPHGSTGADGSTWDTAGTLADLPRYVAQAAPGDEVWIRGDAGNYHTDAAIVLTAGGNAEAPVTVRGVDGDGDEHAMPLLIGTRAAPYDPHGDPGSELFKLLAGADHLAFRNLAFANQGNGVFRVGADVADLTLERMRAENVRRFFEDHASGAAPTASISGLRISDVTVAGFSKGAIRLRDDTHDVVIRDVTGDSQRQDGDRFAIGVHLDGTVHDVLLERVTMRNSHDSVSGDYWNGDGFAAERGTYDLTFVDTEATGSTDAGYDLKSRSARLIRTVAADNKRNYRFWGRAEVVDAVGRDPYRRGGAGRQAQVWAGADARVTIAGATLADARSDTVVFEIDDRARVTLQRTTVRRAPGADDAVVAAGARLHGL